MTTGTPRPTREITWGFALSCTDPGIHGNAISHLGEPQPVRALAAGQSFPVQGGSGADNYLVHSYYRPSETQLEQIYGYFTLTIDGVDGVDGWLTHPSGAGGVECTPVLNRTLTCAIISAPFAFVPDGNYSCVTGDICPTVNGSLATVNNLLLTLPETAAAAATAAYNRALELYLVAVDAGENPPNPTTANTSDSRVDPDETEETPGPYSAYAGGEYASCQTADTEGDGGYCGPPPGTGLNVATNRAMLEPPLRLSTAGTQSVDQGPSANLMPDGSGWGIATQLPEIFSDSRFGKLGVNKYRFNVPYDIVLNSQKGTACGAQGHPDTADALNTLRQLLAGARGYVTISFEHCRHEDLYSVLPSIAEYEEAVRAFRKEFIGIATITAYTAWNEPNHNTQPTSRSRRGGSFDGARRAAVYWRNLNRACDNVKTEDAGLRSCVAVAGDFIDGRGFTETYFKTYKEGLAGRKPSVWAFHAYATGKERNLSLYQRFADFLPATSAGARPQIWLTEQGGLFRTKSSNPRRDPGTVRGDVSFLLNNLVNSDDAIKRFYYYAWRGDPMGFDSGLIAYNDNRARVLYYDYRCKTNPSLC